MKGRLLKRKIFRNCLEGYGEKSICLTGVILPNHIMECLNVSKGVLMAMRTGTQGIKPLT